MFGRIGMGELLLIFGIVLLVFGPSKLPSLAKSLGTAIKEFRKGSSDLQGNIEKLADEPVSPVAAAAPVAAPVAPIVAPVDEPGKQ